MCMSRFWLVAAGLAPLWGCMASGVQFAGSRQPPLVEAMGVRVGLQPPEGMLELGRAKVECTPLDPEADFARARLSDLSCSQQLLHSALREAAARAGGTFASVPECEEKRSGSRFSWLGCESEVWAPAQAPNAGGTAPAAPAEFFPTAAQPPMLGAVQDAWQIEIDYWPAAEQKRRAARELESVVEVDFPRVGQRQFGYLSAECDGGCALDSLRRGLRAAAAWVGAGTLVGVHCIQKGSTHSCSGSLSVPEHDEPALSLAGKR
jgi:hypothetical protein